MLFAVWLNADKNKITRIEDITYSGNNPDKDYVQKELNCDHLIEAENLLELVSDISHELRLELDFSFLLGATDVAKELGWAKQKITTYRERGKFPEPIGFIGIGKRPVWLKSQISRFSKQETKEK